MAFIAALGQKEPGPEAGLTTLGASSSSSAYSTYTVGGGHEFARGDFPQQQQHQREFQIVHRHNMAQGERPQSHHFALSTTEDVKPSTHDFLSLYDKGSQHVDHSSGPGLSSSLTTHDFLQPLERGGAQGAYRDTPPPRSEKFSSRDRDNAQSRTGAAVLMDRLPPTAIPNYATIQVPYGRSNGVMEVPPNSVIRMVGDAEALRTRGYPLATLSSREDHSGGGGGEGLRGVEVAVDTDSVNARENVAYWPGLRFKFGLPPDLTFPASTTAQSGTENGHQPSPVTTKQRTQGTQGMIEAAKRPTRPPSEEDEDEDEDSQERPRGNRKETLYQKGEAGQKMDSKNTESMRGGTPRSKHSATEQRRRSKINDRFQMLRDLVPHSDQKRDKASFLLEVIDYIQILQEKVRKYETAEQGRHQERLKSMVWDICKRGAGSEDEASQINALVFAKEFSPGVPLDVKQVAAVAADLTRSRAQLPSDLATTPLELHSTGVHNIQNASNRPASSIHSCVSSLEAEKENATALMAQPLAVGVPAQQAMALPYALPLLQPKQQQQQHHHDQVYVRGLPTSNSPKRSNLSDTTEPQNLRLNGHHHSGQAQANSSLEHQFEVRLRPSTAHESDQQQASGQFSKMEPHVQSVSKFVGKVDGAKVGGSPKHPQSSTQESQDKALRNGRHSQAKQTDDPAVREEHGASPRKAEAPMSIQGGVINVSTIYSQGLLDTLTKALQSSGLDLSRANISVQIDLGKNATIAAVDTSAKVATTPESSAQSHQSQGRTRASPLATGPEPPLKKPKLESQH